MFLRRNLRGLALGALLGLAWYSALLLPAFTRHELTGANGRSPARMLLLMVLASALLTAALPFARLRSSRGLTLFVGLVGPILGALIFAGSVLATDLLPNLAELPTRPSENPEGPISAFFGLLAGGFLMFLVGVPTMAAVALSQSCLVTIPMGLLHVEVATRLEAVRRRPVPARPS